MKKLSILICSIRGREAVLKRLLRILMPQTWSVKIEHLPTYRIDTYFTDDLEIIVCSDAKQMKIGKKRNLLTNIAKGEYICFIDDDDSVEPTYIQQILEKTSTAPDCIVFDAFRFVNGRRDRLVKYGIEYNGDSNSAVCYYRLPNHLMVFKRSIALQVPYEEINFGEDSVFAKAVFPLIKTQERIDKILYHYLFTDNSTSKKPYLKR